MPDVDPTISASALQQRAQAIHVGCGEAIDWVAQARTQSARLDREADALIERLRRARNQAARLGRAATRPLCIGFFGLSQAGKSYLISALAAGTNGELETDLAGQRLNFIQHVNPPGHGKEATGLVTRFTRQPVATPAGYPLVLSLLSEVDLAKVLGNAFLNDFDREQIDLDLSADHLRRLLTGLQARRQPVRTAGVSEDQVIELLEYFEQRFPRSIEPLRADYWPSAVSLAPWLDAADRATLFSILWGEVPELTATYLTLQAGLAATGHAEQLYCPLEALVQTAADGTLSQAHSIMNVDILERLGRDEHDPIEVIPCRGGQSLAPVALPRSLLAALSTELRLVLAQPARTGLLEQVDLLDFPGYRGRLAVANLGEVRKQLQDDQVDPLAQLVLRGKVAYLFERYTDEQEMHLLVLCAPAHKQSDVKDLGPVLAHWVERTQGVDPQARAAHPAGLLWAITMFDFRLNPVPGETEDLMRKGWEGMLKLTLLERFGGYEWLQEWTPGQPFDNLFLVRKPRMAAAVIATDSSGEQGPLPPQQARLALLRRTFCADPLVRKHLRDPGAAWDAMLTPNDGGVGRLGDYLAAAARPAARLAHLADQVAALTRDLVEHRFAPYYRPEGAAEVAHQQRLAERVIAALSRRPTHFADLLAALQPTRDDLRALYLRAEDSAPTPPVPSETSAASDGGLIDLGAMLAGTAAPTGALRANAAARRYAQAVLRYWVGQLMAVADDPHWLAWLGLERQVLEALVGELIIGAERLDLETELVELLAGAEAQTAAMRARLVERQAFVSAARLARFVAYLGCDDLNAAARPRSRVAADQPVFAAPAPIAPGQLPVLAPQPLNYSALYILDWFEAFRALAIANAGQARGDAIDPAQNAALGAILARIDGSAPAPDPLRAR